MLDVERYSAWKREFTFWREIYQFLPDSYLFSVIGAGPTSILKNMVMKLFRDTTSRPWERTISNLVKSLDKTYALTGREREMASMERLFELKREPAETMQSFWLRFDMILNTLEGSTSLLSSELLFMRALKSLQLSFHQKTAVLTFLECRNCEHTVDTLRSTSIRLFGMYTGVRETTAKTFVARNEADNEEDLLLLLRAPKKKARP